MGETLKRCPFCGTPAEAQTYPGGVRVGCVALECTVAPEVDGATLAIAADLWNTRAAPHETGEAERLREAAIRCEVMIGNALDAPWPSASMIRGRLIEMRAELRAGLAAPRLDAGEGTET